MNDDTSNLLDGLNAAQREAVTAPLTHVLILAGAGSGKTRVLVQRIAWLLRTEQALAPTILAVTFTNRAAGELRERITQLLKHAPSGLWAGTFHGLAHRLLRIHWREAQLPESFQILDSDDQLRTIRRLLKSSQLDEKKYLPRQVQQFINQCKERGQRAQQLASEQAESRWLLHMTELYVNYENFCQQSGLVDFTELLLRSYELLRDNAEVRDHYQNRFRHILVDEFQDTNYLQYEWLKLLAGQHNHLFIVGDDDQSIYGWRGARIENIQSFQQNYNNVVTVRLEQNYRSTGMILKAANAVISHNTRRLGKELWTDGADGDPLFIFAAYNEDDEAAFIVSKIQAADDAYQDNAILYRTSAQSRLLEEALLAAHIPYRIFGGMRFYERAEIKDVLAFLRLVVHRDDDTAFERVINIPKRGVGERTMENIRAVARQQGVSLWQALNDMIQNGAVKGRALNALLAFQHHIETLTAQRERLCLSQLIKYVVNETGFPAHYQKEGKEEAQRRLENLAELVNAAVGFEEKTQQGLDPLSELLAHAALEAGAGRGSAGEDCVQLMTLHLAKGLEFKRVFLCGLDDGLFPHQTSLDEGNLEEERRLCYVGITRAREQLYLSHCETRYRYGQRDFSLPSRFLKEIPIELTDSVRLSSPSQNVSALFLNDTFSAKQPTSRKECTDLCVGDRVLHKEYGEGVIVDQEGQGEFTCVQVAFAEQVKWLILKYAQFERL